MIRLAPVAKSFRFMLGSVGLVPPLAAGHARSALARPHGFTDAEA